MNSFEWNKIFGGVLAGALLVMVIRIVAEDVIFAHDDLETDAFPIEVVEETGPAPVVVEETGPTLAELLAGATADDGASVFRQCAACHSIDEGGRNGVGPNLYGVVGAAMAGRDDFSYSGGMAAMGVNWTYEALDGFLENPRGYVSGTKMAFGGLRKATDRARVIQYLRSFSPDAPALPEVAAMAEEVMEDAVEGGMMMVPAEQ